MSVPNRIEWISVRPHAGDMRVRIRRVRDLTFSYYKSVSGASQQRISDQFGLLASQFRLTADFAASDPVVMIHLGLPYKHEMLESS